MAISPQQQPSTEREMTRPAHISHILRRVHFLPAQASGTRAVPTPGRGRSLDAHFRPPPRASTAFGQRVMAAGRSARQECQAPLGRLDYHFHRPHQGMYVTESIRALFKLQAKADANEIFRYIITINTGALEGVKAVCEEEIHEVKRDMFDIIHQQAKPSGIADGDALQKRVTEVCALFEERDPWIDVLELEIQISQRALKRLDTAAQARKLLSTAATRALNREEGVRLEELWGRYLRLREEMIGLALRVNKMTGTTEFVQRHQNELWDVVESGVEET